MKRGRTAITWIGHITKAAYKLGIRPKKYRALLKNRHDWNACKTLKQIDRMAFGRGPNPKVSVLLVPELRKRRSERDPILLAEQIKQAANTEAAFR